MRLLRPSQQGLGDIAAQEGPVGNLAAVVIPSAGFQDAESILTTAASGSRLFTGSTGLTLIFPDTIPGFLAFCRASELGRGVRPYSARSRATYEIAILVTPSANSASR